MTNFSSKISTTTRVAEILVIAGSMMFVYVVYPTGDAAHLTIATLLGTIIYSFAAELTGANADLRLRPFFIEARRVLGAWILTFLCLIVISWATKHTSTFSRLQIGMWAALGAALLVAARGSIRNLLALYRRQGRNQRKAVLIGAGSLARQWIQTVRNYPELGIVPVAAYDDDPVKIGGECKGVPVLGDCGQAVAFVNEKHVPMVFLTLPLNAEKRTRQILDQFLSSPANLYIIPDIFTFQLMNLNAFQVGDTPVIALSATPMSVRKEVLKRTEDLIIGALALIIASPLMLAIAAGIKFTSRGPVFFRQWRYGLEGRKIRIWKFRTMCVTDDGHEFRQATRNDCRVTTLGRLLRRFSLDELPQLFNVLDGSMSLVGPRPHAVAHDESFRSRLPGYMWRLKIKPGITGWAQVNGWRGETNTIEKMEARVKHDIFYIENWSISLDVRILWMTLRYGFVNDNAY